MLIRVILITLVFSSCVYNTQEPLPLPITASSTNDTVATTPVTYSNFVKKVMDDNCVSCHSSNGLGFQPFLVNYTQVKQVGVLGRIKARTIDENPTRMPIAASLPQTVKDTLQIWLNGGMPE